MTTRSTADRRSASLQVAIKYLVAHEPEFADAFDSLTAWIRRHVPGNVHVGPDETVELIAFFLQHKKTNERLFGEAFQRNEFNQALEKFAEKGRKILSEAPFPLQKKKAAKKRLSGVK